MTELGNPGKPRGEAGAQMLARMNQSHAEVTHWGLDFAGLKADSRVLDIGCGGGAALAYMAQTVTAGHLTGVDHSPVSVAEAAKYNRSLIETGRMDIVEGSVSALPFPDASFDCITTVESFYFWPEPLSDLREVRRVLAENGCFVLIADIHGAAELPEHALENIRKYALYNPTPETFRDLFIQAGFADVQVHLREGTSWICVSGRAGGAAHGEI